MKPRNRTRRLVLALGLLLNAAHVQAQRAPSVAWQPEWEKVRTSQYIFLAVLAPLEVYLELGPVRQTGEPRLRGPWPGDTAVRALLRVEDPGTERAIEKWADYLWWPTLTFPLYADALAAALIGHGEPETAWQLTAISLQALLSVTLVARIMHVTLRRQRPVHFQAELEGRKLESPLAETLSLPGGHAATSFAGAGLACSFHRRLPLFGGGLVDDLTCGTLVTVATTVAMLRVLIDRHYFSDTLIGSGLGFAIGYFLPELLHFGELGEGGMVVVPRADEANLGLSVLLTF